ncbi:NAD(P)/FAD-dependent oxidoreductase [Bacillota bacterium LX-D]|nr:NAD(P)/FAD-dependent oxidoreductase [Bacillota bacterium LX-D]
MFVIEVAIMGAGLSGLVCAKILEQHGINPVIFEKRKIAGDRFVNGEILLDILNRPYANSLAYFANQYGIYLRPIAQINKITFFGENSKGIIRGNLGYSNLRGRHPDSFDHQLAKQVKAKIVYNSDYTIEELAKNFTQVVVATGDAAYNTKMQNYEVDLTVTLKGATVEGIFKFNQLAAWLNNNFAPQGYAYLIPFSGKEANIVFAFPDYPHNAALNIEDLWEKFYTRVCQDLGQNLRVTDTFEVKKYIIGRCLKPRINNILFTGNCFGTINPAFGFGQFNSILTGIYAAKHLCNLGDYEELTKGIKKNYLNSLVLRRIMEQLNNPQLDLLVRFLESKLVSKAFSLGKVDYFKLLSYVLRPVLLFSHPKLQ